MKLGLLAVATLLMAATAQADYVGIGVRDRCGYHRCGETTRVGVACAPEVVQGNVVATDHTLQAVVATPDFATATQFKAEVNRIAALNDPNARLTQYFGLIGIDPSNTDAVASFVGAREVNPQWLTSLQQNTGLTNAQADTVATQLQTALRGGLQ